MADTPEWLKPSEAELAMVQSGSTDLEEQSPTNHDITTQRGSPKRSSLTTTTTTEKRSFQCSFGAITVLLISTAFLAIFVYSTTVQSNDRSDNVQWLIFYALSATLVAMFMVHYLCCFPSKIFYLLSMGMSIWAIVIIVFAAMDFTKTEKGGAKAGTGDNDNQTLQQELAYELGGASLSLFSSFYHAMLVCCCINKERK